nr:unnamed protein product [Callosobruchus analis]
MSSVSCIRCMKVVKNGTYSIKCQNCLNWLHRDCANITIEEIKQYEKELKLPNGKRFECFMCLPQSPKHNPRAANNVSMSDGASADTLFEKIRLYLDERLDSHMSRIMEENAKLVNLFQTKITNMEIEIRKISSLQDKVVQLEQQLATLTAKLEESDSKHTSTPQYDEMLIEELQERQARSKNILMFGIAESSEKDRVARAQEEKTVVENTLRQCSNTADDIKLFRLGKYEPGKVRPIKVMFTSAQTVTEILKNKSKISNDSSIYIKPDLTKQQREHHKQVIAELERRKQAGEQNLSIRYSNRVPKIVFFNSKQTKRDSKN